jgi:hypothetical protein
MLVRNSMSLIRRNILALNALEDGAASPPLHHAVLPSGVLVMVGMSLICTAFRLEGLDSCRPAPDDRPHSQCSLA